MPIDRVSGKRVKFMRDPPQVRATACIAGKREGQGPLRHTFDDIHEDTTFGLDTWEKAESRMLGLTLEKLLSKGGASPGDVDMVFGGDLLNQCISTCFGLRDAGIPFVGLYGACSTMAEGLMLAAMAIDGGFARRCAAITCSHFCSAERQFRFPLEYGGQRPQTSQWTVTGSGGFLLEAGGGPYTEGPWVSGVMCGRIVDMDIKDANNMGAAMAPAAVDTLKGFFDETGSEPSDFDLIITGDLSEVGSAILTDLMAREGYDIAPVHSDCGLMIFDRDTQDVHAGGSGCGCSAVVMAGHVTREMREMRLRDVLFVGTGALMSPTSLQQGNPIMGIAHLVHLTGYRPQGLG